MTQTKPHRWRRWPAPHWPGDDDPETKPPTSWQAGGLIQSPVIGGAEVQARLPVSLL